MATILQSLISTIKSPILRKKLADNQKALDHQRRDNISYPIEAHSSLQGSLEWKLDGKENEALLRERGFYSLIRMIALPNPSVRPLTTNDRSVPRRWYQAVLNRVEFNDMLARIARSKVCAIDTEADDKDPRTATLFGISLALARGATFFVPFCERDMGNLTQNTVRSGLTKLFKERIRFVGHNLKYDLMLLHRNGIEPPMACFDTLLAAHDCYGDLDFFSLRFLAQRLLGQKIKSYAEIVPKGRTFLELPFEEMMEHACVDAEVALRLHRLLERELKGRGIDRQFEDRTMPLTLVLCNLEKHGIPVDGERLEYLRGQLVDGMVELKRRICEGNGREIDPNSREEVASLIGETHGFRGVLGRKSLTQPLLEQLAGGRPLLKLVVEYKRMGRRLKRVESIIKAARRGRVYPLLSQTRMRDGRISSTDPDLFADDGIGQLRGCVGGAAAAWLPDRRRSLDLAQRVSGDLVLKNDRTGPGSSNLFMTCQPNMNGLDHDDLLLRVLIGESSHRLSTRFLVDRLTVDNIVYALETRYPTVFRYLAEAKAQGLKRGYVEQEGVRRYFDGLGSSSIEKRYAAQRLACQWLLQF
jgi:DNA polymerase-1